MSLPENPLGPEVRAELEQRLVALEAERRSMLTWILMAAGGVAVVFLLLIISMQVFNQSFRAGWLLAILATIGLGLYVNYQVNQLRYRGKIDLMERISSALGLEYRASVGSFPMARFTDLGLLPTHHRRFLHDHLSSSTSTGEALDIIDARLQERRYTSGTGRGRSRRTYVNVFRGLLLTVDCAIDFSGQVLVLRDRGLIGNSLTGWRRTDESVLLESARFNSTFTVYSEDQVVARRLLTPGIMQRCLDLAEQTKGTPQIAFSQGKVLITLHRDRDSFELPQIWERWNAQAFEAMLDDLRYALTAATLMGQEAGRPDVAKPA